MQVRARAWAAGPVLIAGAWGAGACARTGIDAGWTQSHDGGVAGADDGRHTMDAPGPSPWEAAVQRCPDLVDYEYHCGFASEFVEPRRTNVLLVVDQSGSMADVPEGYRTSKWEALQMALSTVLWDYRHGLAFGLRLFPSSASDPLTDPIPTDCGEVDRCCEMPRTPEPNVPLDLGEISVPRIIEALTQSSPAGGAPTAVALAHALEYFSSGPAAGRPGDEVVLLVTDGGPSCTIDGPSPCPCYEEGYQPEGCDPDDLTCCIANTPACLDPAVPLWANQLHSLGITTLVLGLPGSEPYGSYLQELARTSDGYIQATGPGGTEGLVAGLEELIRQVLPRCEVPTIAMVPNRNIVDVAVDCEVVPLGYPDENTDVSRWYWSSEDPALADHIVLAGPVCERIWVEPASHVDVVYGCGYYDIY